MSRRYSPEFHTFMREYIPGHTAVEIRDEAERRFGIARTLGAVKSYKKNHGILSGTPCGLPKDHPSDVFPAEVKAYVEANYRGVGPTEMAKRLNAAFGKSYTTKQLNSYYKNHGLDSGLTGRFEEGHTPPNKGRKGYHAPGSEKGWFTAGHVPANKMPIGTVWKKADGYLWRKIGEGCRDWRQEHILVWEAAHGPVPAGMLVIFLDGNRENTALDNLALISKKTNQYLNKKGLRSSDPEVTRAMITAAQLFDAVAEKRKELNDVT